MRYYLLPKFLQVELTYGCNSACTFCYNPNHKKPPARETTEDILSTVNALGIDHVQLIGGEVSLIPDLTGLLDRLPDVRWKSLVTNGRINIAGLAGRVNEIYLSLHGDPATHEALTRARGSFAVIAKSILHYVDQGISVHADTVLTRQNFDQMYSIAEQAKSLGMSSMFVNVFQPAGIGSYFSEELYPTLEHFKHALTDIIAARRALDMKISFGTSTPYCLDERLIIEELAFTCGTGTWFGSVDPWGEFRICNQSTKSYGNILAKPFAAIWHSAEIDRGYRNLKWLPNPCRECVLKDICLGGCRISDTGAPRIDPMVSRYPDEILSGAQLTALINKYPERIPAPLTW